MLVSDTIALSVRIAIHFQRCPVVMNWWIKDTAPHNHRGDIDEVKGEIIAEIKSRPQYPNVGKKSCLKRISRIEEAIKTLLSEEKNKNNKA